MNPGRSHATTCTHCGVRTHDRLCTHCKVCTREHMCTQSGMCTLGRMCTQIDMCTRWLSRWAFPPVKAVLAGALFTVMGCTQCGPDETTTGGTAAATSAASIAPSVVPPPLPWTFATVRGPPGIAAPDHCRFRAPLVRAPNQAHIAADPRTLGTLLVADVAGDPVTVVRSGTLRFDQNGKSEVGEWAPWPFVGHAPRAAKIGETWMVAWDVPREGGSSEVVLFRGGAATSLGEGDAFSAVDLGCTQDTCVLVTSRKGRVAPAGADVHMFGGAAGSPLKTVTIEPAEGSARPFGLAAIKSTQGPIVVLADSENATFWRTEGEGSPATVATVPTTFGVLDAAMLGETPVLMAHGNAVDEKGCAREGLDEKGARVRFLRPGKDAAEVRAPGAPSLAALRALESGALALWLSPLGCGSQRSVLFAVVLDEGGVPVSAPIPVGDSDTFVVAAVGSDVDLWTIRGDHTDWLRLTCAPK
ncbi:MAG: hypothetical protein IPK82_34660 [Polyangiaceae bacterium]|nr:hypothetical protein [Polyangiaceae bacterium]